MDILYERQNTEEVKDTMRRKLTGRICIILGMLGVAFGISACAGKEIEKSEVKIEEVQKETEASSKKVLLELEQTEYGSKIPAGNRENIQRLTIRKNGCTVFEIKKEASENQVGFEEWYVTEPYSYKQLVNVSDLYHILDHYSAWPYIAKVEDIEFEDTGIFVEEEFSDTGIAGFHIGQKNEKGNYYVKTDFSEQIYEMDGAQIEAMTGLHPEDFMMGIAGLVYVTTVEQLEIKTENTETVFDIETDAKNDQSYWRDGKEVEGEKFKKLYASLLGIVIKKEAGEEKKLQEPVLRIYFRRNTEKLKDTEIIYYPYDSENYLIEKDGYREFLADKESVDKVVEELDRFCG